jgi:ribosome-dependent ATPase
MVAARGAATLEDAFIDYLAEASGMAPVPGSARTTAGTLPRRQTAAPGHAAFLQPARLLSYAWREALELRATPSASPWRCSARCC